MCYPVSKATTVKGAHGEKKGFYSYGGISGWRIKKLKGEIGEGVKAFKTRTQWRINDNVKGKRQSGEKQ